MYVEVMDDGVRFPTVASLAAMVRRESVCTPSSHTIITHPSFIHKQCVLHPTFDHPRPVFLIGPLHTTQHHTQQHNTTQHNTTQHNTTHNTGASFVSCCSSHV